MSKLLRINILLFTLMSLCCFAQKDKVTIADSLKSDSKYIPTGIRVGYDLIALLRNNTTNNFNGYELNADIDFYRYYLAFDYGSWGRTYSTPDSSYFNDGNYFRVGADVNFLLKDPDRNMFFLGLRYGRSTFSEQMNILAGDSVWGFQQREYTNTNAKARWLELTTGIRVQIWKVIWMGYTARFKFSLKADDSPTMIPHDVPGYGRTDKTSYWGFNYQIFVRIPFRTEQVARRQ